MQSSILIAEDDMANRMIGTSTFEMLGYETVEESEDDESTMEILTSMMDEESNNTPILCFIDLHMPPGEPGNVVAKNIREKWPNHTDRKDGFRPIYLICCSAERICDLEKKDWANVFDAFAEKPLMNDSVKQVFGKLNLPLLEED